jgi:hypothetical protein
VASKILYLVEGDLGLQTLLYSADTTIPLRHSQISLAEWRQVLRTHDAEKRSTQ